MQADNVANQQTAGFKAKRAELVAEASGGVRVSGVRIDPMPAGLGASNVDPTTEAVAGLGYDFMYRANLKVLQTQDELAKATMELKG